MYGFMRALLKALDLVKQNREVTMDTTMKFSEEVPIERTYDFSFAKKADSELTPSLRKPRLATWSLLRNSRDSEVGGFGFRKVACSLKRSPSDKSLLRPDPKFSDAY